uniref:Dystonin n=1 Tax=Panagrolaimus sp. ES5 TaxID=591445 RepID=A0AC34GL66_9BILA
NEFNNEEIFKQPVASELDDLRRQQNAIKQLKSDNLKPILEETEKITEKCKDLIRSAGSGIPTKELEGTLKSLGDAVNDINSKVEERDRTIDSAIQGLGSYNDAYKALLNWIEEIEDLVSNQKPPSADYKVARAQLQNHDFQLKLIDDKQNSVDGFLAMIGKVEALTSDEKTKAALRAKA